MSGDTNTAVTILLVEDDPPLRSLVARMLQSVGFNVLEAVNGLAALDAIKRHRHEIDLTLTDIMMPHMDGFELSERLQAIEPGANVLFLSGQAEESVAVRAGLKETGRPFLLKPFTRDALVARINAVLATDDRTPPVLTATPSGSSERESDGATT